MEQMSHSCKRIRIEGHAGTLTEQGRQIDERLKALRAQNAERETANKRLEERETAERETANKRLEERETAFKMRLEEWQTAANKRLEERETALMKRLEERETALKQLLPVPGLAADRPASGRELFANYLSQSNSSSAEIKINMPSVVSGIAEYAWQEAVRMSDILKQSNPILVGGSMGEFKAVILALVSPGSRKGSSNRYFQQQKQIVMEHVVPDLTFQFSEVPANETIAVATFMPTIQVLIPGEPGFLACRCPRGQSMFRKSSGLMGLQFNRFAKEFDAGTLAGAVALTSQCSRLRFERTQLRALFPGDVGTSKMLFACKLALPNGTLTTVFLNVVGMECWNDYLDSVGGRAWVRAQLGLLRAAGLYKTKTGNDDGEADVDESESELDEADGVRPVDAF